MTNFFLLIITPAQLTIAPVGWEGCSGEIETYISIPRLDQMLISMIPPAQLAIAPVRESVVVEKLRPIFLYPDVPNVYID